MSKAYWFYHKYSDSGQMQRVLLLQKSTDKDDAKEHDIRKGYRSLGATASAALQSKKLSDVEVLVSSKVAGNHLGVFENSLSLANYEFVFKKQPDESEEKKE